jgi:pimeloyl-ACP methyl ester carboxylesterase
MPQEEGVWASIPYVYGPATVERAPHRVAEDVEQRLRFAPSRGGYEAQLAAASRHDTTARLAAIAAPALVLHGDADRIVPVGNGRRLAERLPSAQFRLLTDAGHLYMTDTAEADEIVVRFLGRR